MAATTSSLRASPQRLSRCRTAAAGPAATHRAPDGVGVGDRSRQRGGRRGARRRGCSGGPGRRRRRRLTPRRAGRAPPSRRARWSVRDEQAEDDVPPRCSGPATPTVTWLSCRRAAAAAIDLVLPFFVQRVAPQRDDVRAALRLRRALRAAAQPRRGRARQGEPAGQDRWRRLATTAGLRALLAWQWSLPGSPLVFMGIAVPG